MLPIDDNLINLSSVTVLPVYLIEVEQSNASYLMHGLDSKGLPHYTLASSSIDQVFANRYIHLGITL